MRGVRRGGTHVAGPLRPVPALEHAAPGSCVVSAPMLAGFTQSALDLVFPALCPVCQTTLGADRRDPICGPCWHAIARLGRPRCHVCGAAPPLATTGADGSPASEPAPPPRPCPTCLAD